MAIRRKSGLEQLISDIHAHSINHHTREIYLHSYLGDEDEEAGVDYRMSIKFIKNLHALDAQSKDNILVHMHTPGGSWADGMAMYDAIRFCGSSVTILAYAYASSMSGILLQGADKRILMPNCEVMIHHGSISLENNSIAVKSAIDVNEKYCKQMLKIFAKRAIIGTYFTEKGFSEEKIVKFIDKKIKEKGDWYLCAEEALYYGFADGILGEKGFESLLKIRNKRKTKF